MSFEDLQLASGHSIPDSDGAVFAGRGDSESIRAEFRPWHSASVPGEAQSLVRVNQADNGRISCRQREGYKNGAVRGAADISHLVLRPQPCHLVAGINREEADAVFLSEGNAQDGAVSSPHCSRG